LTDGISFQERVVHATGSLENPMTDVQLEHKFRALAATRLPHTRVDQLLDTLWRLEHLQNMSTVMTLCRA
jgi:2-methylcitrate dehydratase PrpD